MEKENIKEAGRRLLGIVCNGNEGLLRSDQTSNSDRKQVVCRTLNTSMAVNKRLWRYAMQL